jgi:hypothetical protein
VHGASPAIDAGGGTLHIADGAAISEAFPFRTSALISFDTDDIDGTNFNILGCHTKDGTFKDIFDVDGNQVTIPVAAGWAAVTNGAAGQFASAVAAFPFLQFEADTNQTGAKTFRYVTKRV